MRQLKGLALAAALVAGAALASGCHHSYDDAPRAERTRISAPASNRARPRTVVKRVARPKAASPGAHLRRFCGQRHVEFQAGRLREAPDVMARNNELCRQIYAPGASAGR